MQKRIVILGSTGSIGQQALDVARAFPGELKIVGLAAHSNVELFAAQVREWQPEVAVLSEETAAARFRSTVDFNGTFVAGTRGLEVAATWENSDMILGAMLGAAGLPPTLFAIRAGKDVAIANKETLVAAGEIVMHEAREHGVRLLPVDSEHSAIAQCLIGEEANGVESLTITASGGPFVETSREELETVAAARALKHPTWTMGRKITIDSATLMNKGLEMIEARWLFDVPMENIDVVVHRQSIVHSFVTFVDGSVKAQLGVPDMRLPIQHALLPERKNGPAPRLNLAQMGNLTFEAPDHTRFPAINLAWRAMEIGGVAPAMLNAANEEAVQFFLDGKTNFYGITDAVAHVLERCPKLTRPALADVFAADAEARRLTHEFLQ
ncbi:MAG TPA: 1-deoxy-D-xylulose-5-phosphate reductoisomerase [Abditibacteriaceae bacterium]|jgi:1-deoxy-D-xylulose-5-phosphate reductoisomerase